MARKCKILDTDGNPIRITVSLEDGTTVEIDEFDSIRATAYVIFGLESRGINCRIEVL